MPWLVYDASARTRARLSKRKLQRITIMGGGNMARITRRRVLKLSGAGVVAAQTGGLAAILVARFNQLERI